MAVVADGFNGKMSTSVYTKGMTAWFLNDLTGLIPEIPKVFINEGMGQLARNLIHYQNWSGWWSIGSNAAQSGINAGVEIENNLDVTVEKE